MPKYEYIHDRDSQILPTVGEMRKSQAEGNVGEGLNEYDCTDLNAVQGHKADIKEHMDAEELANKILRGMTENEDAEIDRLDRTPRGSWPDITEL
jgi:hypothetical protein